MLTNANDLRLLEPTVDLVIHGSFKCVGRDTNSCNLKESTVYLCLFKVGSATISACVLACSLRGFTVSS